MRATILYLISLTAGRNFAFNLTPHRFFFVDAFLSINNALQRQHGRDLATTLGVNL